MKGKIQKLESLDESSGYNAVDDVHQIEFDQIPKKGHRFYVRDDKRGSWSTSGVMEIEDIGRKQLVLRTHYSKYLLTIEVE